MLLSNKSAALRPVLAFTGSGPKRQPVLRHGLRGPAKLSGESRGGVGLRAVADETTESVSSDYTALEQETVWLVSEQRKVPVTSLWTTGEKCVLVFARSMGCVFCQEYARQLVRDVLPKLEGTGTKLFFVSIGTPERGLEFAELTGFPADRLLADPENVLYDAVGFYRNVQRTFFDIRTPLSIFGRAFRRDKGADLVEATRKWKAWIPPKGEQALQQGGVLVFSGSRSLYKYVDEATASHLDPEELLRVIMKD